MTKKRLTAISHLHDTLYARACKVFEGSNPCKINRSGCIGCRMGYVEKKERCCSNCKYLGPKGCTVQALFCKMWVCDYVILTIQQKTELLDIQMIADKNDLLVFRGSKEDALKQAIVMTRA